MASSREKPGHRVCVVGAGPCGLTALKNLRAAGLHDVVCYDEGEAIGGNWAFDERPERHSIYDATHLISSKRLSEFEDYPMPDHYPDFPSHRQVRDVFRELRSSFWIDAIHSAGDPCCPREIAPRSKLGRQLDWT